MSKGEIQNTLLNYLNRILQIYIKQTIFLANFIYQNAIKTNDYLIHGHKISGNEILTQFPFSLVNNDLCGQVIDYKGKPYKNVNIYNK